MSLDTFAAQVKLHEVLVGSGFCGGRVFDAVPDSPSKDDGKGSRLFPFCVIDDVLEEPADLGFQARLRMFQTVQIYTRYRGKKKVRQLADAVRVMLHGKFFTLASGDELRCLWQNTQVFHESDNRTYRAVMRFQLSLKGEC